MKKFYLILCTLVFTLPMHSQYLLGLANSNYGGLNSVMFNPAMGNKTYVAVNLAGVDMNSYNNYLRFSHFKIIKAITDTGYFNANTGWDINKNAIEQINGKAKYMTNTLDLRGPGVLVGIGKFQVGLLLSRVRVGFQLSGVDETLARNLYALGKAPVIDISNVSFAIEKFTINLNAWTERGLTGAFSLVDDKESMLRIGATIKSLNGLGAMYIQNGGAKLNFYRKPNSNNTDSVLYANYDLEIGMTNEFSYANNPSGNLDTFTANHNNFSGSLFKDNVIKHQKRLGGGMGLDLGFVYEKREGKKSKYLYRLAASLVDIGAVKYTNTQFTYVTHYKGEQEITFTKKPTGYNSRQYDTSIANYLNAAPGKFEAFNMALPTSLNVSFDYRVVPNVYVNGTWIQSVRSKYVRGVRAFSSLSVAPRYEIKNFMASLPIVLNDDYKRLNIGLCILAFKSFYIGSDNIGGAFGIGDIAGFDLYTGLCVNIAKHKRSNADHTSTKSVNSSNSGSDNSNSKSKTGKQTGNKASKTKGVIKAKQ